MRVEAIAALAFVAGLALAVIGLTPVEPAEALSRESVGAGLSPVDAVTPRQAQAGIDAPAWREGDAWRVSFNGGEPGCWIVVAAADEVYQPGVSCKGSETELVAANLAALGQGWLGPFTTDLEGLYQDEVIAFYDWPLRDGKTWETTWFGADLEVEATYGMVEGPHGAEPGYLLEMRDEDGDPIAVYDYVPSIGWWSRIEFPRSEYAFTVVEHERGWEGPVVYGLAETLYETTGFNAPSVSGFAVDDETDVLVFRAVRSSQFGPTPSGGVVTVRDPAGNERHTEAGVTDGGIVLGLSYRSFSIGYIDAQPGTWTIAHHHVGLGGDAILIRGVALTTVDL